jgi:hypothetical protein
VLEVLVQLLVAKHNNDNAGSFLLIDEIFQGLLASVGVISPLDLNPRWLLNTDAKFH